MEISSSYLSYGWLRLLGESFMARCLSLKCTTVCNLEREGWLGSRALLKFFDRPGSLSASVNECEYVKFQLKVSFMVAPRIKSNVPFSPKRQNSSAARTEVFVDEPCNFLTSEKINHLLNVRLILL